jgi:hypothetical protein
MKSSLAGGSLVLAGLIADPAQRAGGVLPGSGACDEFVDVLALVAVTGTLEQFAP